MQIIADLHIHSRFSRACSQQLTLENIAQTCAVKGVDIVATGDFTHPEWFKELKEKLVETQPGLYQLAPKFNKQELARRSVKGSLGSVGGTKFLLSTEISCIYSKGGKVRRLHIVVLAPNLEAVEKINTSLSQTGAKLKADGRPIIGMDVIDLAKLCWQAHPDCMIIPAHCLLPDSHLHIREGIKKIRDIEKNDYVLTHQGRYKKVEKVLTRSYKGKIYHIKPFYFRPGLITTPEHPFYTIKTYKNCSWTKGFCKLRCSEVGLCKKKYFKDYKPEWVMAKNLEKSDVLLFPRYQKVIDKESLNLDSFLGRDEYILKNNKILLKHSRAKTIKNIIKINKDFCRLVGYYLAEGYTDNRDCVSFCFHQDEYKYIDDVVNLMKKVFGVTLSRKYKRQNTKNIELIFYSKILVKVFSQLFYNNPQIRNATTKQVPNWMIELKLDKQADLIKGWWYGDNGYTSSRFLMNQIKIIFLRLGIIPSIRLDTAEERLARGKHNLGKRVIRANVDNFNFSNLSFFKDKYNLLKEDEFKKFKTKMNRRHGWLDDNYIYIPVRDIEVKNYRGEVYNLEVEDDNSYVSEFAIVHNCWTPWFAMFGSKSGFDSMQECWGDVATPSSDGAGIYAIETGLSSDPAMNWRVPDLDNISIISNSDAHSLPNIAREANVFEIPPLTKGGVKGGLSYNLITQIISNKNPQEFLSTIEFYPEEGMYHWDGHRDCSISFNPKESKKLNNICPVCKKPLTIGVLNRVEELAAPDRPENYEDKNRVPYKKLIELDKIIAQSLNIKSRSSKQVQEEYKNLINNFGTEFKVLLDIDYNDLKKATLPQIVEGIKRARQGKVHITPGFDGQYGKIKIFDENERIDYQKSLF